MDSIFDPPAIVRPADDMRLVAEARSAMSESNSSSWRAADAFAGLAKLGWSQQKIAEACGTNRASVGKFIACVNKCDCSVLSNRPPFWEVFKEVNSEKAVHVSQNTGQPEWYTPPEYIEAARKVLGTIDLDPATSEIAQRTVQAARYFTANDDGLSHPWAGAVWMNPPYAADLVGRFTAKLCEHVQAGDVTAAIILVNNATDAKWFQQAAGICAALCFPSGRIKFLDEEGNPGAPLQGQALLYFGLDIEKFPAAFGDFGFCVRSAK